ncbi:MULTISPECIES: MucR family transcriptional regulator [Sphingomonadaceae]|jgi:predicted transcriptional regulator|uniref:MucR family transcriptional regulator n=1 Tax=Novosphingobium guangzhouense TaxID=1850347 RepID=A0A2K2FXS6_9SPHN|nr:MULTISPECIES: MucR family transcriptional regulator [Sphingomonadaceae]PNU03595.1 hypothetical protein A8V01_23545 [Novosphingobium guangzhouense]
MAETENPADLTALTVELLSAYLTNNTVGSEDLPRLIRETRLALTEDTAPKPVMEEQQTFTPAVSIRKSLSSSAHIVSLIDGKPYKTLKRHLASNGLTPEAYRERYKLPADYPMVAPDFTAKRRAIAERIGLGNRPKPAVSESAEKPVTAAASAANAEPVTDGKPAKAETSAAKTPTGKGASPKSVKPAGKLKRKAAPKPTKVDGDAPVVAASEGDKAPSVEPVAPEAKAKPKSSSTSEVTGVKPTPKKRAAGKGSQADGASAAIAAATPSAAPEPDAKPPRKPRGKLGLFGKGQATPSEGAPAAEGETNSEPLQADKPGKAPRPKRMARTPKPTTDDAS